MKCLSGEKMNLNEFSLYKLSFLYIKRSVVEIYLDIKIKVMSSNEKYYGHFKSSNKNIKRACVLF
jgi:hypothetical protein